MTKKLKHLTIRVPETNSVLTTVRAENAVCGGHARLLLHIIYDELDRACGAYLSPGRVRRLRDYLTAWLREHGGNT